MTMKKPATKFAVLGFAILVVVSLFGPDSTKRAVNPPGTVQGLPFSNGILVGVTRSTSPGQEGLDNGKLRPGRNWAQTQAALENIKKIVQACRPPDDRCGVCERLSCGYLTEFGEMNKVYKTTSSRSRGLRAPRCRWLDWSTMLGWRFPPSPSRNNKEERRRVRAVRANIGSNLSRDA